MTLMGIGEFADRTRLSPKALRLYDRLGLVVPARVDPDNGYRLYEEDQVESAQLVGLLRRMDMPLAAIESVLRVAPEEAAGAVTAYWAGVEAATAERRALTTYVLARLDGREPAMYEIAVREMPERGILSMSRHVHTAETDAFFHEAFGCLRAAGPGLQGIAGAPFLIFYGEVSEDSDGPMELCRPVAGDAVPEGAERRIEPAHEEAFIRLTAAQMGWPTMAPAYDALVRWVDANGRQPAGPVRQVLIADQRTAARGTRVCDLSVPLR